MLLCNNKVPFLYRRICCHIRYAIVLIACCPMSGFSQVQSDTQFWLDTELNYTFRQRWLFQDELSYQTLISGGSPWYSLNSTATVEYNLNQHLDIVGALPFSYTMQHSGLHTSEIGVMLGTRIYLTPVQRIQVRLLLRFEERWSHDSEIYEWNTNNRIRLRGEVIFPINKSTYFADRMWYTISDTELFLITSKDLSERFSSRTRFRAGFGYRLSYKARFEALYICQLSRNTISDDFNVSNIIRLRFKYYF